MRHFFFFFNDTATTEIYTLSLHDALPIWEPTTAASCSSSSSIPPARSQASSVSRSEEHTSELQSQSNLVCRLLLEKKKNVNKHLTSMHEATRATLQRRVINTYRTPCSSTA